MTNPRHAINPHLPAGPDRDSHAPVGVYLLDALPHDEQQAFQTHLDSCAACQTEVIEFRETLTDIAALTETTPPPGLRANILDAIVTVQQVAPEQGATNSLVAIGTHVGTKFGDQSGTPRSANTPRRHPGKVVNRSARWHRITEIAVAAAAAVALAISGWAVGRHQQSPTIQADQSPQQRLLSAPDAQIYHQPTPGDAHVTYIVSPSHNAAVSILTGQPHLDPGHVFQLWTMHTKHGQTIAQPDQTFTAQPGHSIWLTGNITNATALAITVEPNGGSPTPTTTPFAVQQL